MYTLEYACAYHLCVCVSVTGATTPAPAATTAAPGASTASGTTRTFTSTPCLYLCHYVLQPEVSLLPWALRGDAFIELTSKFALMNIALRRMITPCWSLGPWSLPAF